MNEFFQNRQTQKIMRAVLALVFVSIFFLITLSLNALKENKYIGSDIPPMNVISVMGEGEVFAVPDTGRITFTVNKEAVSVKVAQDEVLKQIDSILEALKGMGIEEKDLKTLSYNAYPRYEYRDARVVPAIYPPIPGGDTRVLAGYNVSQTVEVKIRDTSKAGDVLGKMGELGVTDMSGLYFSVDDEEALVKEARALAIADAKTKAKELAKDLGVSLKRVVSFSENDGYYPYARTEKFGLGSADMAVSTPAPQVPTGESKITSQVTISYEIR